MEAGDIVILIIEKPHKTFERKGADLIYKKEITLLEALTGTSFVIQHLDGRKIRIQSTPGQVIKPDSIMTCEGLGMPFYRKSYQFGNLFVQFKVKFPSKIEDQNSFQSIKKALSSCEDQQPEKVNQDDVAEESTLTDLQDHHKNTNAEGGKSGQGQDEDDEDDEEGGPRVGCQQQ